MFHFFCTGRRKDASLLWHGRGSIKAPPNKKYIPLPSPCRRGLGRGSGRGKGEGSDPSVNDQQYP